MSSDGLFTGREDSSWILGELHVRRLAIMGVLGVPGVRGVRGVRGLPVVLGEVIRATATVGRMSLGQSRRAEQGSRLMGARYCGSSVYSFIVMLDNGQYACT